jgi:hypothetical protein
MKCNCGNDSWEQPIYYALKGDSYDIIKNKASLLSIVGGRKKEIQQHLRQKKHQIQA